MNLDYQRRLEREIDRELKSLPELTAPPSLIRSVMDRIDRQSALPWYRCSWQRWPGPVRIVSFALLAALFAGICIGGWELWQWRAALLASGPVADGFAKLAGVWNAARILARTALTLLGRLSPGVLIACLTVCIFSYFACVGVGTLMVRFAYARIHTRRQ